MKKTSQRSEDLSSCIVTLRDGKTPESIIETTAYGKTGRSLKDSNSSTVAAIAIKTSQKTIYKIKLDKKNKPYNPSNDSLFYGLGKIDKSHNDDMFKLREVNEACFNYYIDFLKKKHESLYILCERNLA